MPTGDQAHKQMPEKYASKLRAARDRRKMVGERRVVTILFSDVKGSTAMAEGLDPEVWAEIMDGAFEYLIAPIYRYEGTVARLMGDAILAFFGAPIAHEDDPQRAVLAGLDILDGIQPFCREVKDRFDLEFSLRVGIHTGTVVVGEIGSDLAMEYTAMGDAVNLASRMEQTAQPGSIQISEDTHKLVAPLFEFEPLGSIEIKGKQEPIDTYQVLRRRGTPGSLRGLEGLSSPIVGRGRQMEKLFGLLDGVRNGRGAIALLIGEAGMGKSRMIQEVKNAWLAENPDPLSWMETRGVSYEGERAYGLFQHVLRSMSGVAENDPADEVMRKIQTHLQDLPEEASAPFEQTIELLLALETDPSLLAPEEEDFKRRLFNSSLASWSAFASAGPIVFVFDDLHWADSASIELLVHLIQLSNNFPVLFLCAMRPYRDAPGWDFKAAADREYPHRYNEFEVLPLNEQEGSELMTNLLAITNLSDSWKASILQKAEGNPFFVEEIIRALIERGFLAYEVSKTEWYAAEDISTIDLPDTLQSLLISRIDRLEPDLRRTLQLAAVIGRSFYYRVLEKISDKNGSLEDQLIVLQRYELIHEQTRLPELEFMFRHDLTRDAAYETILHRDRRTYHRRVGEALETLFESKKEEQAYRLAYHFLHGEQMQKAFDYAVIAGDRAARMYANEEALSYYDQALQLLDQIEEQNDAAVHIYLSRGRRLELMGRFDEALENYERLEALGKSRGDRQMELASLIPQVTIYSIPSGKVDFEKAQPIAERALDLAEKQGDPRAQAKVLWSLMLLYLYAASDASRARDFGERSLEIAEQHGLEEERAYALHDLSRVYSNLGMDEAFLSAVSEARDYWERQGNQAMLADILTNWATRLYFWGQVDKAQELLGEALEVSRSIDNAWGEAYALSTLGVILFESGRISEGRQAFDQLLVKAREADFVGGMFIPIYFMWVMARLGAPEDGYLWAQAALLDSTEKDLVEPLRDFLEFLYHVYRNEFDQARQFEQGEQDFEPDDLDPNLLPFMFTISAECSIAFGDDAQALEQADTAVSFDPKYRVAQIVPHAQLQRSRALRRLGRIEEARQGLESTIELARPQRARLTELRAWTELVLLEEQAGNLDRVQAARAEAAQIAREVAEHIDETELRDRFVNLPDVQPLLRK